jgi:hypothetical protein
MFSFDLVARSREEDQDLVLDGMARPRTDSAMDFTSDSSRDRNLGDGFVVRGEGDGWWEELAEDRWL